LDLIGISPHYPDEPPNLFALIPIEL